MWHIHLHLYLCLAKLLLFLLDSFYLANIVGHNLLIEHHEFYSKLYTWVVECILIIIELMVLNK